MSIVKSIKLHMLKRKLKSYQKGSKRYETMGISNNWYNQMCIPNIKRSIRQLESELNL